MHVTVCLAGQDEVDVEVGESCRTLQALKEAIVVALPQLCVEGFDVSVGGRALDDDEGVVSLVADVCLDVSANSRGLSVLALREAGREVSKAGLFDAVRFDAAEEGDVSLVTLYLDAGVPVDCRDRSGWTPLHLSCDCGHVEVTRLLLDRCAVIDARNGSCSTPLHRSCIRGSLDIARLLLDRGSAALNVKNWGGETPLHLSCHYEHLEIARLLLDRGAAIDEKDRNEATPLHHSCINGDLELVRLLLDRGCSVDVQQYVKAGRRYPKEVLELLSERGHDDLLLCGLTPPLN